MAQEQEPSPPPPVAPQGYEVVRPASAGSPLVARPGYDVVRPATDSATTPPPTVTGLAETRRPGFLSAALDIGGKVLPAALEVGGGVVGQRLFPGGGLIRRAIGSGLGEAAGRGAATPLSGPPTVDEAIASFASGAGGEVAASGLMKAAAPFAKRVTARGRQLMEDLRGEVFPSQVTKSPIVDFIENIATGPLGHARMDDAAERQLHLIENRIGRTLEDIDIAPAPKPQAQGRQLQTVARSETEKAREAHSAIYEQLWKDTQARGVGTLDASSLVQRGAELEQQLGPAALASGGASGSRQALGALHPQAAEETAEFGVDTLRQALSGLTPDDPRHARLLGDMQAYTSSIPTDQLTSGQLSPQHIHQLRSLYARGARLLKDNPDRAVAYGHFAQLAKRADEVLQQLPKDLYDRYQEAGQLWAQFTNTYRRGALRNLVRKEPQKFMQQLIRPHDVESIEAVKSVLPAEDFAHLQRAFAENLLQDGSGGIVGPARLRKLLGSGKGGYGPEVIEAMFPGGKHNGFYQLQRILEDTVGKKRDSTGKMYIQLATAGALSGAAAGILTGDPLSAGATTGAVILLTPSILSRIVTSSAGRRWLTTGLRASPGGEVAIRSATQLANWLLKEGIIDDARPTPQGGPPQPLTAPAPTTGRGGGPGPLANPPAVGGPPAVR